MAVEVHIGDCRQVLKTLPDQSVQCVVTSPPYFGLRDYGVDGQVGLEASPAEFVQIMVDVFREVRRVLRDDGTLWLNLGDSYSSGGRGGNPTEETSGLQGGQSSQRASMVSRRSGAQGKTGQRANRRHTAQIAAFKGCDLPPKNLIGIPWRVAFALQADGWYLRQDIIWNKRNPMPESVRDRCTKAHEYIFLLSKSERYFYDAPAIAEPCTQDEMRPTFRGGAYCNNSTFDNSEGGKATVKGNIKRSGNKNRKPGADRGCPEGTGSNVCGSVPWEGNMRNKRSVWDIGTKPFPEAHFATFPPELPEICILAGSQRGAVILDPFGGAGTTGLVADRLQRDAILIELNPEYAAMAKRRISNDAPMLADVRIM